MSFRPHPNVDRALAQVQRRRPLAPLAQLGFGLRVDEYRLSTRPRVVGAARYRGGPHIDS
ncbi:hypothetical protein MUK60_07060 [Streptomyces sp. LRE541]|uniref:hypothetical protein n=1 Tax=Streptomyces sp. LRE541 TaxID=2931983 RepID=UPI00200F0B25|nr:hypothetical protein [Streptomyces sp. LRE541]UPZ27590.1 hypothetical protein MUK60_07060 [Streptomyces sp. LRE541]